MNPTEVLKRGADALEMCIGNLDHAAKKYHILDPDKRLREARAALADLRRVIEASVEGYVFGPNDNPVFTMRTDGSSHRRATLIPHTINEEPESDDEK